MLVNLLSICHLFTIQMTVDRRKLLFSLCFKPQSFCCVNPFIKNALVSTVIHHKLNLDVLLGVDARVSCLLSPAVKKKKKRPFLFLLEKANLFLNLFLSQFYFVLHLHEMSLDRLLFERREDPNSLMKNMGPNSANQFLSIAATHLMYSFAVIYSL